MKFSISQLRDFFVVGVYKFLGNKWFNKLSLMDQGTLIGTFIQLVSAHETTNRLRCYIKQITSQQRIHKSKRRRVLEEV